MLSAQPKILARHRQAALVDPVVMQERKLVARPRGVHVGLLELPLGQRVGNHGLARRNSFRSTSPKEAILQLFVIKSQGERK